MGSPCEVLSEGSTKTEASAGAERVAAEAWRIEDKFSRYRAGNIVDRINTSGGRALRVDDETAELLNFAETLFSLSEGQFDITSGVLRRVWRFDGSDRIPAAEAVDALLPLVGWRKIHWQPPEVILPAGMEIDLGGIGKEYAVDRAAAVLREVFAGPCLINFGGDLVVTGPPAKRGGWRVGIDANDDAAAIKLIELRQGALATSGDARRFLEKDGVRYGHIIDPLTGWPVPNAARSITVAADTCTQAGMLSTLAMLKGSEAERFLAAQAEQYWCFR